MDAMLCLLRVPVKAREKPKLDPRPIQQQAVCSNERNAIRGGGNFPKGLEGEPLEMRPLRNVKGGGYVDGRRSLGSR